MEFGLMVDAGMRPAAALIAGTSNAARLLGLDSDIGTLAIGKAADIVAVPGNPLTDIRATERPLFVMQRGRVLPRSDQAAPQCNGALSFKTGGFRSAHLVKI